MKIFGLYITFKDVDSMESRLMELHTENNRLRLQLNDIKPIVEHKDFKPALSKDCVLCKFRVMNLWTHEVIGCRKDNLCEDYTPEGNVRHEVEHGCY